MDGTAVITGRTDAGAFLARLVRLNPAALVRLRPRPASGGPGPATGGDAGSETGGGTGRTTGDAAGATGAGAVELWAVLPFRVVVTRVVAGMIDSDVTYSAADLLQSMTSPNVDVMMARRDDQWRTALPPSAGRVIETMPAAEVLRVASAAEETLRSVAGHGVGGRQVGERAVRDALLDHVPIVVTADDGQKVKIPQRLVQGLVRMGFLGSPPDDVTDSYESVTIRIAAGWLGLGAAFGSAWYRAGSSFHLG